jgi:NADH-ubiquinone oxidoreductase chain 3
MTTTTFFFIFIPFLAFILLVVNLIFAPHNPYQEKDSAFECGFHSFLGQNRTQFSISFFIFALLFLLFDLEILLVYPYIVSSYTNNIYGLIVMLIFFLMLTLGFAFELGKNALKIDSRQIFIVAIKQLALTSVLAGFNLNLYIFKGCAFILRLFHIVTATNISTLLLVSLLYKLQNIAIIKIKTFCTNLIISKIELYLTHFLYVIFLQAFKLPYINKIMSRLFYFTNYISNSYKNLLDFSYENNLYLPIKLCLVFAAFTIQSGLSLIVKAPAIINNGLDDMDSSTYLLFVMDAALFGFFLALFFLSFFNIIYLYINNINKQLKIKHYLTYLILNFICVFVVTISIIIAFHCFIFLVKHITEWLIFMYPSNPFPSNNPPGSGSNGSSDPNRNPNNGGNDAAPVKKSRKEKGKGKEKQ